MRSRNSKLVYTWQHGKYVLLSVGLGSWTAAHMSPRFSEKLTWVGWIISVFTWLFLSHLISRLGGTKLCKHGIFEISFVVIKLQTAPCITILVVFSNCAVDYHIISQNLPKCPSQSGGINPSYGKFYPTWLRSHLAQNEISPLTYFICVNKGHADLTQVSFQVS
jgi:hypothetical protein